MSDAPKAQTALDYCIEIAANERMSDYWTCWDDVAAQYRSPNVLASSADAELAALRKTIADQAAEIERLRAALIHYSEHDQKCPAGRSMIADDGTWHPAGPCACGLYKALKGGAS